VPYMSSNVEYTEANGANIDFLVRTMIGSLPEDTTPPDLIVAAIAIAFIAQAPELPLADLIKGIESTSQYIVGQLELKESRITLTDGPGPTLH